MKNSLLFGLITLALTVLSSCNKDEVSEDISSHDRALKDPPLSNDVNLVINGPADFSQIPWEVNYIIGGESVLIPGDFTLSTPNPILSESGLYSDFVSNIPVDLTVTKEDGGDWYALYQYNFKNRSNKPIHLDCAFLIFIAPDGSNMHHGYLNDSPFGHPQQDYVEVPIAGTHNSYYIVRLVFHDVTKEYRTLYPGTSFQYYIGCPLNPTDVPLHISTSQSKFTVRLIADLTGNKNEDLVRKYGTKRYRN